MPKLFWPCYKETEGRLKNLTGREGKVIESGPDDYVFVNFAGHGGPGRLAMPSPPSLHARALNAALKEMSAAEKFAKLVFYVEACEAGSMFQNILPRNINVYVTTATDDENPSYSCYFDSSRHTWLGDLYSVNWMENTDEADLHTETLQQQYEIVKAETSSNTVMQYGDTRFKHLPIEQFLANGKANRKNQIKWDRTGVPKDEILLHMAGIHTLQKLLVSSHPRHEARRLEIERDLHAQIWIKNQTAQIIHGIARQVCTCMEFFWVLNNRSEIRNWQCYENVTNRLFELCPRMTPHLNDFVLGKLYILVNLCNRYSESEIMPAVEDVAVINPLNY